MHSKDECFQIELLDLESAVALVVRHSIDAGLVTDEERIREVVKLLYDHGMFLGASDADSLSSSILRREPPPPRRMTHKIM